MYDLIVILVRAADPIALIQAFIAFYIVKFFNSRKKSAKRD